MHGTTVKINCRGLVEIPTWNYLGNAARKGGGEGGEEKFLSQDNQCSPQIRNGHPLNISFECCLYTKLLSTFVL